MNGENCAIILERLGGLRPGCGGYNAISGCSAVGSAPALGAGCRRFKSCHSDHLSWKNRLLGRFFCLVCHVLPLPPLTVPPSHVVAKPEQKRTLRRREGAAEGADEGDEAADEGDKKKGLSQNKIFKKLAQQKSRENPIKTGFSRLFLTFDGGYFLTIRILRQPPLKCYFY